MTNLIRNGDFTDGENGWTFYSNVGGMFRAVDGHAECTIAGNNGRNVQLYQSGLTLKAVTRYRLTFNASSNGAASISAFVMKHTAPNTSYGLSGGAAETHDDLRSFAFEFQTPENDGELTDGRLRLALYGNAGTVFRIGQVSLIEIVESDERDSEPEPPEFPELPSRRIHVIAAKLNPGDVLEVRYVNPTEIVTSDGDIDWEKTPSRFVAMYRHGTD